VSEHKVECVHARLTEISASQCALDERVLGNEFNISIEHIQVVSCIAFENFPNYVRVGSSLLGLSDTVFKDRSNK